MHYDNYNLHCVISIHALLAESDAGRHAQQPKQPDFYPRSPCGERPEAPVLDALSKEISIHALLAESDDFPGSHLVRDSQFLSTLSLRRATLAQTVSGAYNLFLSTLSLRRATTVDGQSETGDPISIHALLAESDFLKLWQK